MHRENGTIVDLNYITHRAIGKMKATITQRVNIDDAECDVECDCRFIFLCEKTWEGWKTRYVKVLYDKDRLMAVDGRTVPVFGKEELGKYPRGCQYLGAVQSRLGHKIDNELLTLSNEYYERMYVEMANWFGR